MMHIMLQEGTANGFLNMLADVVQVCGSIWPKTPFTYIQVGYGGDFGEGFPGGMVHLSA
jgi:hypothetical protein